MPLTTARRLPSSTYRLQLNHGFTFGDLQTVVPYLSRLGITDCYCSPILLSAPGSSHGYDVNDYRRIDPELGGEAGFQQLLDTLGPEGMGVLLDFVPNHMGIQGPFNEWWLDVLESGPLSPYAHFFDIRWNSFAQPDDQRIMVPVLNDHYGRVLEQGGISVVIHTSGLAVSYGDFRFPLNPSTYGGILKPTADDGSVNREPASELMRIAAAFAALPRSPERAAGEQRARRLTELKQELSALLEQYPDARAALEKQLVQLNGQAGDLRSFERLDALLERQYYRLARWKAGVHEINYRRFFAVDSLAGLRMENKEVFDQSHVLIARLLPDPRVTGLRIDHIDGLWDPEQYLQRLQQLAAAEGAKQEPLFVVVEKILSEGEELPAVWPMHGTTGYEFIRHLAGALVDPAGEAPITALYQEFTGEMQGYREMIYRKKRLILEDLFANAVIDLGQTLADTVSADRRWRDLTRHELVSAVREFMACLNVYRTYRREGEPMQPADRKVIEATYKRALVANPRIDPEPLRFVRDLLTGDYPEMEAPGAYRHRLEQWTLTVQQYTGAVMAKSVEDTAYYTYCRFIALNEVGGDPGEFGAPIDAFHDANEVRLAQVPQCLLATSTHDTKLSEDVRARLYALSEIPAEWRTWVTEWHELNREHRKLVNGVTAPDRVDEYRLYQVLLGAWPLNREERETPFRERIREHTRKALNEARRHTTWLHPNEKYMAACDGFIDSILSPGTPFRLSFEPKAYRLARLGMVNSLTQVVLKCTVPGIPDFYQGNEIWDFSLVDPDNRRPVDFNVRQAAVAGLQAVSPAELLANWRDGRIKLRITQALLELRRARATLFQAGRYLRRQAKGNLGQNVIAFSRIQEPLEILVIVPRLAARLGTPPVGPVWDDTRLVMETGPAWRDVISGRSIDGTAELPLALLLEDLPVAVLERTTPAS